MNGTVDYHSIREKIQNSSPETKIYLGCDSIKRFRAGKAYVKYATICAIHVDGNKGCEVMGYTDEQIIFEDVRKPIQRLMAEAYRVSDMYLQLKDAIGDRHVEIHLDINPNPAFASNLVYQAALGVVKGLTDVDAYAKPESFAASIAADHFLRQ